MITISGRLYNQKAPEKNYTIFKYGETFYGRNTALIPTVVMINRFIVYPRDFFPPFLTTLDNPSGIMLALLHNKRFFEKDKPLNG